MIPYVFLLLRLMAAAFPVYLLVRRPWKHKHPREILLALFWVFQVALLAMALQGTYQSPAAMAAEALHRIRTLEQINLIPFHTITSFFTYLSFDDFCVNILGNLILFTPWGFGLPLLWKRNQPLPRMLLHALGFTLGIEFCQLFIGRHVDVDDLILNFSGGFLGGLLYPALVRKFPRLNSLACGK